jgi:alpha-L-fucosidase 2
MFCSLAVLSMCSLHGAADGPPLDECGLRFDTPVTVWDEALPLGNGLLGALVWGDGAPMNISMNRTDLWDLRPVPEFHSDEYSYATMREWEKEKRFEDLVRVYEKPYHRPAPTKIPAGRITLQFDNAPGFKETALDIGGATAGMTFANGASARVWVHATEPLGIIEVTSEAPVTLKVAVPAFGGMDAGPGKPSIVAGDVAQLGYPDPQESAGDQFAAYEQEGWEGFRFAAYLGWRRDDAAKTTVGIWTVASSFETDGSPLELARERVEQALDGGLGSLRASHEAWWKAYWQKTWLRVPNKRIERQWYLDTYKFGAAARVDTPPITLQGPWTADDGKLPPWKGDYHHDANTQMSYWPAYSGNRLAGARGFVDWLWDTRDVSKEWTRTFFDMPGMNVPMTADLNQNQIGGWRQYTHSSTTGAWLSQHFYWQWKYTADPDFLRDRAYPYVKDCAIFIEAVTNERDEQNRRTLPLTSAPEFNGNAPNAWYPSITNHDLALIRWLLGAAKGMAAELGLPEDAARWERVLDEMPELSLGDNGALLVAPGYPLPYSHRHFSQLMALHPLGLVDLSNGEEDQRTIRASLEELDQHGTSKWVGFSFAWLGCVAARAKDGAKAEKALDVFAEAFVLRNSFNCNGDQTGKGYSDFTYRPFTLEANFAAAAGLQEMLLQSHTGVVEVFPAIPPEWKDVAFHDLRAQGAFLVSAEKGGGEVVSVKVRSERGGVLRIRSPKTGEVLTFEMNAGETVDALQSSGE